MDDKKNNPGVIERAGQRWGQYRIISSIEQGRFSRTYLGEHLQNPTKQFVIEILPITLAVDSTNSFIQSAQRLTQLVHPHILRLADVGVENFTPYLVMDYVSHNPLRQLYPAREGQPLDKLLPYLKQIASALQYAHEKGCLHKHLRPDTVLLGWNASVLLCDFAIDAIDENERYQEYQRSKYPADPLVYMAPEQIQHHPVSASDQYSLGIMVYEWLSGVPPFLGTYVEMAKQHVKTPPPSLRQKIPQLAPAVEEVVFTALAKDPGKRFGSVIAFINALEQAYSAIAPSAPTTVAAPQPGVRAPQVPPAVARPIPPPIMPPVPLTPPVMPPKPIQMAAQTAYTPQPMAQTQTQAAGPASASPQYMHEPVNIPSPPIRTPQKAGQAARRAFIVSAAGVALVGGVGSWLLWEKLHPVAASPTSDNTGDNGNTQNPAPAAGSPSLVYRAHTARVNSAAWSPDGTRIVSASDDKLVLISDTAGKTLLTYSKHKDHVNAVAWSPNGKFIASGGADKAVHIWEAATGKIVTTYQGHSKAVNSVSWSKDSRLVASGSDDTTVQAWFATNGNVFLTYREHTNAVIAVAWAPNTQKIASGSWDNRLNVFSTINNDAFAIGDTIFSFKGHTAEVFAVAWSPDGKRVASAGGDNVVQICSGTNGASVQYPPRQHTKPVRSLAWSPDNKYIVSGCDDNAARIWDAKTGTGTFTFSQHSDAILTVAVAPDSKSVISAGADKTLQVWQPQ